MKNKILIISGDPNSINSEIIFKSLRKIDKNLLKRIYLISNYKLMKNQFRKLKLSNRLIKVKNIDEDIKEAGLKLLNIDLKFTNCFNVSQKDSSNFILSSLNYAHKLALRKDVKGIINCAINKNLLKKSKTGVTEFLASKCAVKKNSEVMLINNKKLSVCPITTHINVSEISKKINSSIIVNKVKTIQHWLKSQLKRKPKIAILGLNPHNGELRKNSEEQNIIIPAILRLKKLGVKVKGPFISDTIFINEYKNFDVIVGMYHDQVLAPYKTLFKFDAINITLGLKYLRVSPDHGVAHNLIGKNKADETSLLKCINFVNKFVK